MIPTARADGPATPAYAWPRTFPAAARRHDALFEYVVLTLDVLVLALGFVGAYVVRQRLQQYGTLLPVSEFAWIGAAAVPLWVGFARGAGLMASQTYRRPVGALALTVKVHAVCGLVLLSALYLLKAVAVSRLLIQTFLVISAIGFGLERLAIHAVIVHLAARWTIDARRRLLVVGPPAAAEALRRVLRHQPDWTTEVAGVLATDAAAASAPGDVPLLGRVEDLDRLLDTQVFDEIVVADPSVERALGDRLVSSCLERGLAYRSLVRMPGLALARQHAEALGGGHYLLSIETTPQNPIALAAKRAIDVAGALAGLAACAVVVAVFGPIIRLTSAGPAIFRQCRVGRNGRRFTLYKLRTMRSDAEAQQPRLAAANAMRGYLFKIPNDPRVTSIGRFLRRTYLDEMPQFWNVLKGDMSLVGTRPPTPDEFERYQPHHRRRLSMRPGLTGLWQCQGNLRVLDFEQVVDLDCEYIDRWSIWLDLRILARTCLTVVRLGGQ
jgi:exopolysaccharide biosynthesis polyprenyl glycosylphosphotransferase